MPMQAGPEGFQGGGHGGGYGGPVVMPVVKGPSRAPGTTLIIVGILMSIVVAPILFFVLMFQGLSGMTDAMAQGAVVTNGGTVEVSNNGSYTIVISNDEADSCKLIDSSDKSYEMSVLQNDRSIYYLDGLKPGTYTLRCQGLDQQTSITGLSVSATDLVSSTGGAFLWSTLVGVSGIVMLIVGIVLVVKANGKRKELQQQAMMSAIR